jgi:death on curing protein
MHERTRAGNCAPFGSAAPGRWNGRYHLLARPRATAFGKDAHPDLDAKAAALLHSVARNRALVEGNKRLALAAVIAFYGLNGCRLALANDDTDDLVMSVAEGRLDTVDAIAAALATEPRR